MDEHAHRTFPPPHDGRHLCDAEVGDDTKRDRFALSGRERCDQSERPVEGSLTVSLVARGRRGHVGDTWQRPVGVPLPAFDRSDVVDPATRRDGEQPTSEVGFGPVESVEARCHLDPHRRGQVFGLRHALGAEIAEQQVMILTPQGPERVGVALLRAPDHVVHDL